MLFNFHNQPVGWLHFAPANAKLAVYRKPRWLTRFMFRVFFELQWEDA